MIFQEALVSVVSPALNGHFYDHIAPQCPSKPYGIYQEIVSPTENTLSDGVPIQQSIIQIDVYAEKYMDAITAGKAVEDALAAAFAAGTLQGIQRSRRSQYEPEVKLRRLIYEYSFWYH